MSTPLPQTHDHGDCPLAYVPRTATETALDRIETLVRAETQAVTLSGPCGSGKTLLLHVLSRRLHGDFDCLYVPYPKLAPQELCAWLLDALGAPPSHDAESALHERMACDISIGFPPLVLMIDDAALLPADTLSCLYGLLEDSMGFLHILFVRSESDRFDAFARGGATPPEVALEGAMDSNDTARFIQAQLERHPVDAAIRARLEASIHGLHALTQGNPARLQALMIRMLCSEAQRTGPTSFGQS